MTSNEIVILGDLATWIGAFGTLGAFVVGFKQIHTERHERKKRQQREDVHAEQEQARQISGWVEANKLIVNNSSAHPIHHVTIEMASGEKYEKHTVPPGKTEIPLTTGAANEYVQDFVFTDTKTHTQWRKIPGKPLEKLAVA